MISIRASLVAAVAALALVSSSQAAVVAAVDFNGSGGGAPTGPTAAGYTGFGIANPAGVTSLTSGSVTIALNPSATGSALTSRERGAQGSATTTTDSDLLRDFALVTRDTARALGFSYLAISVSGLTPNTAYSFVGISLDPFSTGAAGNREGFSSVVPTEYAPGSAPAASSTLVYTPQFAAPSTIAAASAPALSVTSNASGVVTVYAFGDATSYNNQTATIVSGFTLSSVDVPEPASLAVLGLGGVGLLARKRRA